MLAGASDSTISIPATAALEIIATYILEVQSIVRISCYKSVCVNARILSSSACLYNLSSRLVGSPSLGANSLTNPSTIFGIGQNNAMIQ